MGWNRFRTYALVAAVALVSTLVVVPAFGSDQVEEEVVNAVEFTSVDGTAKFLYGEDKQDVTTEKSNCRIAGPDGTLLSLSGDSGPPGLHALGIGVRTSGKNANGTPCSQVDASETLTIRPGSSLTGRMFSKVRLDLEVTKDAIVVLTLSGDGEDNLQFHLFTGSNAGKAVPSKLDPSCTPTAAPFQVCSDETYTHAVCAASTSSGPNSNVNDNCIWTVDPGFYFDTIELTIALESPDGTVSLEGGSDTGPANTSLFYLAPDQLHCDKDKLFPGSPTYKVRPENGGDPCTKEFTYDSGVRDGYPFVELFTSGDDVVVFLELLEFDAQVFPGPAQTPSLWYDDDGSGEKLAPFCLVDPRDASGKFALAAAYNSEAGAHLVLPTEGSDPIVFIHTTCIISAEFLTTPDADGNPLVTATYYLYNLNDGNRTFK